MREYIEQCSDTVRRIPVGLEIADADRANNVLYYKCVLVLPLNLLCEVMFSWNPMSHGRHPLSFVTFAQLSKRP